MNNIIIKIILIIWFVWLDRSFEFFTVINGQASIDWEEVNILVLKTLFNPFFNTRTFGHALSLNIDDESVVRMQVMFGEDVIFPWFVFDFELRFADSTNEADSFDFRDDVCGSWSLVSERINDDTEENVHENNVDYHEEGKVEDISEFIILIWTISLPKCITNSTSTSHSKTSGAHQAIDECTAVHVVSSSRRHWRVILIKVRACV